MSKFTENQLLGINKEGNNLLISAGAGSGKTTVLTQRIIRKLLQGININELLVLTFTNAAANEMKERIKKEISSNEKIKGQLALVETANITTFDSYLLTLLKKYSYIIDLNNNVNIGDNVLLEKLLVEVIDEEFSILYAKLSDNNSKEETDVIKKFFDNYFVFDDQSLKDNIKILYYKYKSILDKDKLNNTLLNSSIVNFFEDYEQNLLNRLTDMKLKANQLKGVYTCKKGSDIVEKYLQKYDFIHKINKYNDFILFFENNKMPAKTSAKIDNKELINIYQEEINGIFKDIKNKLIFQSKDEIIKEEKELIVIKKFLLLLLETIDAKLFDKKKEYNSFDFSDINILVLNILKNENIKEEIKCSFNEILIDEYQDTNDFQNYLITLISNNNVYLVGDVKQSIYGFRNANPQNFNELQEEYKSNTANGEVINLLDNFRSREEVLQSINLVFEKLMHKKHSDIDYSDNHALDYGNKTYEIKQENSNYMLEFFSYEPEYYKEFLDTKDLKSQYYEPLIIVNDIVKKIENKEQILENGKLRDIQYKDFAILTKTKSSYKYYNEVFDFYNIPIDIQMEQYINDEQNYELLTLLSILKLINKPNNKLLEVSVLRSFLYRTSDQIIYDYVQNEIEDETIANFKNKILEIKEQNIYNLSFLLNVIFTKFNFFEKVVYLTNTVGINDRLIKIIEVSDNFTNAGNTLTDLISYLEYSLNITDQKLEFEQTLPSTNNVSLMTIHKSKGLEYNVVYLPDLNKELYKKDKINIDLNSGVGFILPTIKNYQKKASFLKILNEFDYHKQMINENIRLLYVAMTRAKEKIIFISNKEQELKATSSLQNPQSIKKFGDLIYSIQDIKTNYETDILNFDYININNFIKADEDKVNTLQTSKMDKNLNKNYVYQKLNLSKDQLLKVKFSKEQNELLDINQRNSIDLGIYLHEQLELINLKDLKKEQYFNTILDNLNDDIYEHKLLKNIITNLANQKFIKGIKNYWTEYEFYYEDKESTVIGIIDLLIETEEKVYIVDYKLNSINEEAYNQQLLNYKKVIKEYFNKDIQCYLYSLLQNELKEVL